MSVTFEMNPEQIFKEQREREKKITILGDSILEEPAEDAGKTREMVHDSMSQVFPPPPLPQKNLCHVQDLLTVSSERERTQLSSVKKGGLNCGSAIHQLNDLRISSSYVKQRYHGYHRVVLRYEKWVQMLAPLVSGLIFVNSSIFIFALIFIFKFYVEQILLP